MASGKVVEVLLAEDNAGDIKLIKEAFKEFKVGHNLHVVNDGIEALAFLRKEGKYADAPKIDLMILDLNLPKKSGMDVLHEVKNDELLKRVPVVILTNSSLDSDVLKSYNLHANCYIIKPIKLDDFFKAIRSIDDFWLSLVKLPSEGNKQQP
ncbi:MAG: response regulator [Candidatus Omnitrophota bacterium]